MHDGVWHLDRCATVLDVTCDSGTSQADSVLLSLAPPDCAATASEHSSASGTRQQLLVFKFVSRNLSSAAPCASGRAGRGQASESPPAYRPGARCPDSPGLPDFHVCKSLNAIYTIRVTPHTSIAMHAAKFRLTSIAFSFGNGLLYTYIWIVIY